MAKKELPKVELLNADEYEYIGVNICPAILVGTTRVVFATVTNRKIERLLERDTDTWSKYFKLKSKKADSKK